MPRALWISVLVFAAWALPAAEREWTLIGAVRVDITPTEPVRLSGYGERRTESDGVEQRLYARAIAIGENEQTCVLIAVENCGITADIVEEVAARLLKNSGLARERLVVCSTHTHAAPAVARFASVILTDLTAEQKARIDKYTAWVTERIEEAAQAALKARQPARLSWSEGNVGFAGNRRVLKEGKWTGFGIQADGPVQQRLPLLQATNKEGRVIALAANYACHCTTLGGNFNKTHGDWAGCAAEYLETEHPGLVALITIGCGADANPNPRGKLEFAQEHGRVFAKEIERLLRTPARELPTKIEAKFLQVKLPLAPAPSKEQLQATVADVKQRDATRRHARGWLERMERGEPFPDHVVLPVANWSFGTSLTMLFLGGEVVVDYDTLLRERYDPDRMWISAYANDVPCYIPSQRILKEGGYEAQFSMIYYDKPASFAPEVETTLLAAVEKVIPKSFAKPIAPPVTTPDAPRGAGIPPPKPPEEALRALQVKAGFRVELVAAEPLVESPVAFDWGPDGRLWVVEMRDYPSGMDGQGAPGGRIKVLTDANGDGRYDTARIFLDNLSCPTAVKVWRDGILVTAAPDIFFAQDTDGDGLADRRETLFTGFVKGNTQHLVNSLCFRLDGGLQVANGDSGGVVRSVKTGETVELRGRDLSIYPDSGELLARSGQTQFGTTRDDWDNWFGGNNSYPMWHYALDDSYLRRNPHVAASDVRVQLSVEPGPSRVYPVSTTVERFNDHDRANRFTSACSPAIYRDTLLAGLHGNAFICEPVHNLVHREVLSATNTTFTSRRDENEQKSEFLVSADNWFRPVWTATGPDGALWIADMYRYVIEHPQWIPRGMQRQLNLRAGDNRGRIYRIVPEAGGRPFPRIDTLSAAALVQTLESPNGALRDLAHQMLLWKRDAAPLVPLRTLAASAASPQARLHALYVLAVQGGLENALLLTALRDSHPGVRRHAIVLSERFLKSRDESVTAAVLALEDDADPQVQMQLAYSLGYTPEEKAGRALARLAVRHARDPLLSAAVASSSLPHLQAMIDELAANSEKMKENVALAGQLLKMAFAEERVEAVARLLKETAGADGVSAWRFVLLASFMDALQARNTTLQAYLQRAPSLRTLEKPLEGVFESARAVSSDGAGALEARLAATRLLGRDNARIDAELELLAALLSPVTPPELQREAVGALGRIRDPRANEKLLVGWKKYGPALRHTVIDSLLARQESTLFLLERMKNVPALVTALDASRRQRLLNHREESVRKRAAELLTASLESDRAKLVVQREGVLRMYGDVARGREAFASVCAACHRLEGVGTAIGPDLTALNDKSAKAMLVAILDPNRAVEDRYVQYVVNVKDGTSLVGKIESETSTAITVTGVDGASRSLLRSDLASIVSSGVSLMPEGLEAALDDQKLADLIAYLGQASSPPKRMNGNEPRLVTPDEKHSLKLDAASAEIYGGRLGFEPQFKNLGFWERPDDHARWAIQIQHAGRYKVEVHYACSSTPNSFVIQADNSELKSQVVPTGSWERYETRNAGFIDLRKGHHRLTLRPDGKMSGSLLDLQFVRLTLTQDAPQPALATAAPDGGILLRALNARAAGPTIKYMPEWQAFGWFGPKDRVEWDVQVERAGAYDVILEWSVSAKESGKGFVFEIGGERLNGTIKSTGDWERFDSVLIGRINCAAGKHTATFLPQPFEKGALLDLREIRLLPAKNEGR